MHYTNGREAKNGDKVVLISSKYGPIVDSKVSGSVVSGILYDAVAGNDHCNGRIAITTPSDPTPDLKDCLHIDDVIVAFKTPEAAPATSKE